MMQIELIVSEGEKQASVIMGVGSSATKEDIDARVLEAVTLAYNNVKDALRLSQESDES